MSLSLPEDLAPYTHGHDNLHAPGAYALTLHRPSSLEDAWNEHYDQKPPYWSKLMAADTVAYVGGASDLLARLEDHRDGEHRQTALTRVCDVAGLHTAWTADSPEHAFELLEPRLARWLQGSRPSWYVHQR